ILNFIVPDPNAPAIENLEGDRTTYASTGAELVDENGDAAVTDADDLHFNGGMLKFNVTFTDGQYEVLGVAGAGQISRVGDEIFYSGLLLGEVDAIEDGVGRALRIDFTTNDAPVAAVQALGCPL